MPKQANMRERFFIVLVSTSVLILTLLTSAFVTASYLLSDNTSDEVPSVAENSWMPKSSMPDGLSIVKAAVANGKIYVMNGSANYEYDPATDSWTAKKPMPTPRLGVSFGIVSCQGKIYMIGGNSGPSGYTNYLSNIEVYDPLTDNWATKKSMPTARAWVEVNVVNDKIYVISGVTDNYRSVNTHMNEVYDPVTDSWSEKQPVPSAVVKGASAVMDNKIYMMGGLFNSSDPFNAISNQIYDPETDAWSFGALLPTPMWYTTAGATTGVIAPKRIYVMGGGTTKVTNVINVYNPTLNNWTTITMPTPRTGHAIATVNDTLYVMGGGVGWHGGEPTTPGSGWTLTSKVDQYTPLGYGSIQPIVHIIIPKNQTYNQSDVSLTFTVDKPFSSIFYSLDGQDNMTITGNTTLTNLLNGVHNITVYAKYTEGSIGASKNIAFSIADQEPFPTTIVASASVVSVAIVAVGLFYCYKKRKF